MSLHACSFCSWTGHLGDRSAKSCPICGSAVGPCDALATLNHNAKTVELMQDFIDTCKTPPEEDWSADAHCKREGAIS